MSSEVIFLSVSHAIDLKAEMTSRTQILTAKQYKSLKSLKKSIQRSQGKKKQKSVRRSEKKIGAL